MVAENMLLIVTKCNQLKFSLCRVSNSGLLAGEK